MKYLRILFLTGVIATSLASCGEDLPDDEGDGDILSSHCKCQKPPQWPTQCATGQTVTWQYKRDGNLSCSSSEPNHAVKCCPDTHQDAENRNFTPIPDFNFPGPNFRVVPIAQTEVTENTTVNPAPEPEIRRDCPVVCSDPDSSYCEKISTAASSNFTSKLVEFDQRFQTKPDRIPKTELMAIFDVTDDPCERSDLLISNDVISNTGKSCALKVEVSLMITDAIVAKILMPKNLSGRRNEDSTGIVKFDFTEDTNGFDLVFESTLNLDYGGRINSVSSKDDAVFIETSSGCLKL